MASKVKQFLEASPYVFDYSDYYHNEHPSLVYKKFIITIIDENKILLGYQSTIMEDKELEMLVKKLGYLVDEIELKKL